jgi:integrase
MASFRKVGKKTRVELMRSKVRMSKTFQTKAEAIAWAATVAREAVSGSAPHGATVKDLLARYGREVSPGKRGHKWECHRLGALALSDLGAVRLSGLRPQHLADWRDSRLKEVTAGSVIREMNLLSAVFVRAVREWEWLPANPLAKVERPNAPDPRTRRVSDDEAERIYIACGYPKDSPPLTLQAKVGAAFRFALANAMRAGEIVGLRPQDIVGKVARVSGKTGARSVPLTPEGIAVLEQMLPLGHAHVFGLTSRQLDSLFRKAVKRAAIEDMHFHDSRAEALTRLARKVDVLTLARISGHRDIGLLHKVYYRESAEDIAARL